MGTVSSMQKKPGLENATYGRQLKGTGNIVESVRYFKGLQFSCVSKHPEPDFKKFTFTENISSFSFLPSPNPNYNPFIDKPFYKSDLWIPKCSKDLVGVVGGRHVQDRWDAMKNESRTRLPIQRRY